MCRAVAPASCCSHGLLACLSRLCTWLQNARIYKWIMSSDDAGEGDTEVGILVLLHPHFVCHRLFVTGSWLA